MKNKVTNSVFGTSRYTSRSTVCTALLTYLCVSGGCRPFDPDEGYAFSAGDSNGNTLESDGGQTSVAESGSDSTAEPDETSNSGPGASSTNPDSSGGEDAWCGDGRVDEGEVCDDGVNDGGYGGCASDCLSLAPHCGDGVTNGPEVCDDANVDSTDGCLTNCSVPMNCMDILNQDPLAATGIYAIDSDGPAGLDLHEVRCDMDHAGGGWTMVLVSADDGLETWTWNNQDLLTTDTTLVGSIVLPNNDYKSAAYHQIPFVDLLFIHRPSEQWASYKGVGDGSVDIGSFLWTIPFPQCDLGAGIEMAEGSITHNGTGLCDTDLYFHPGDFDGVADVAICMNVSASHRSGAFGPTWNGALNNGCPLDDPSWAGLGPSSPFCPQCQENDIGNLEYDGRGFAVALGVDVAGDRLEMYVR